MRSIAIVGGGTAGWMAANLLQHRWGGEDDGKVKITVIEAPDIGIVGVGEGSTPQLKAFFETIGVAETEWMPKCNATYKCGISFHAWSDVPGYEHYFHPFPSGLDRETTQQYFFNSLARRAGHDVVANPDRFFLAARLAANQLAPLPAENFPFPVNYGYHFDAFLVGEMLRDIATGRGVSHVSDKVLGVEKRPDGGIASLQLERQGKFEADFFIDSTGFRSFLLQKSLGVAFRSFGENLVNDSAVVAPTEHPTEQVDSETQAIAMNNGWRWRIPLTNRVGNGYVYSSAFTSDEDAEIELRQALGVPDNAPALRRLKMNVGQVARHWSHNCLAVGLSQGFIEPLEATALHLVQATVEGFIDAIEGDSDLDKQRREFNEAISARFEGVRDYIVAHYRLSKRSDTEYWRAAAANNSMSDRLAEMISAWFSLRDIGETIDRLDIGQYYEATSWHCLMGGYGAFPPAEKMKRDSPETRHIDMQAIDDFVRRCALNFRPHHEVLSELQA